MNLVYDGVLTTRDVEGVRTMSEKYPFILELDKPLLMSRWPEFLEWSKTNLPLYPSTSDSNCQGIDIHRNIIMYCIYNQFFGLKSKEEKLMFIEKFGDCVVNENPFMTIIKEPTPEPWMSSNLNDSPNLITRMLTSVGILK